MEESEEKESLDDRAPVKTKEIIKGYYRERKGKNKSGKGRPRLEYFPKIMKDATLGKLKS